MGKQHSIYSLVSWALLLAMLFVVLHSCSAPQEVRRQEVANISEPEALVIPEFVVKVPNGHFAGISQPSFTVAEARKSAIADVIRQVLGTINQEANSSFFEQMQEDTGNMTYRLDDKVLIVGKGLVLGVERNIEESSWLQDSQGRYVCFLLVKYPDKLIKEMQRLNKGANVMVRPKGREGNSFFLN